MPNRDHYAVLGIAMSASPAEVRSAFLAEARRWHPDRFGGHPPEEAEARMRRINTAWATLGDPEARRRYDAQVRLRLLDSPSSTARVVVHRMSHERLADDDTDVEDARVELLDDSGPPSTALGRLQLVPLMLAVGGVGCVIFGSWLGALGFVVLGATQLLASMLGFVGLPLLAMSKAARAERGTRARPRR